MQVGSNIYWGTLQALKAWFPIGEQEAMAAMLLQHCMQVARVRETEVAAGREQEAARCLQQLAVEREALQRSYQERLDRLRVQVRRVAAHCWA